MFFTKQIENNIFIAFSDTSKQSRELYKSIKKELPNLCKTTLENIKEFLDKNEIINSNAKRQRKYISHLKTYINVVDGKNSIILNIYVLPKDFDIALSQDDNINITQLEKLSFDIFRCYNQLINSKKVKLDTLNPSYGTNFIEFELNFYIKKLNQLYDYLLNYKRSLKDKIIVSDKKIGIEIDELNQLEPNKLNIYQFVKVSHQNDLIIFISSLIEYLKKNRFKLFKKYKEDEEYKKLKKIVSNIDNFLTKISSSKHIKKETINPKKLKNFFNKYQNSKEIQKNQQIYNIIKEIFNNQLDNNAVIFHTIDMARMFEKTIENKLDKKYTNNLYIGEEPHTFRGDNKDIINDLNVKKYLLSNKKLAQYPDFLIKDNDKFHIVDAKYKTKERLYEDSEAFRQVIVYAKLFNKNIDMSAINKILIVPRKLEIELDEYNSLELNTNIISIYDSRDTYSELVFDSSLEVLELDYISLCED
jgi:hypothetical protein